MAAGNIVDQFLDDDRLAHTGAAEQTDLAAFQKRLDQIDDLDPGLKHLFAGCLLFKRRRGAMDGPPFLCIDRSQLVHWLTNDVQDAAQRRDAHRDGNLRAQVEALHAPYHALGRLHRHATNPAFANVLLHFQNTLIG